MEFERYIKSREKKLADNFDDTYKDIKKELLKIYNKYEVNNQIDLDELRKYNRLKKLDDIILSSIAANSLLNKKAINKILNDVIDKTEKESFGVINNRVTIQPIKRSFDTQGLINKEVAGKAWGERLKHHTANFMYDVHGIVRQGLEQGDTYTTMARNVKKKFGKEVKKELFLVRTEARRVQEFTKFETMKEVDKQVGLVKVWHTMKDEAVRSTHQAMEGVEVGMDEEFTLPSGATCLTPTGTGLPEEDCNCRCFVEYKVGNDEEKVNDDIYDEKLNNYGEVLIDKNENFFNAENKDKEMKNFNEISREFLNSKTIKGRKVKNLPKSKYKIMNFKGDYNLVFDHDEYEKNIANWLAREIGGEIYLCPRVELPKGIRTPDYIWDNEKWDLKSINSHGKNTINTAIKNTKNQSKNVILNLIDDTYTDDDVYKEMNRIFSNSRYSYIEKVLLVENYKLRNIFKRN